MYYRLRINMSLGFRRDIKNRDNNQCLLCDRTKNLHIHHCDNNPANNSEDNLATLRGKCHYRIHRKYGKEPLSDIRYNPRAWYLCR